MTTVYGHQYANIPYMGGSYASGNIFGPNSTNQTPLAMRPHNLGILYGKHPNPPMFYPSDNTSTFAGARSLYSRTYGHIHVEKESNKYNAPKDSSAYMTKLKSINVGKNSFKQTLPDVMGLSYKSANHNDPTRHLRRARSSGSVAPKKCNKL